MKIGVDFDRVLFDTDGFKEMLFKRIEDFDKTYDKAKNGVYSPEKHAELMGINEERILETLNKAQDFLYDDIQELEAFKDSVVIVSRGDKRFQNLKIEKSGAIEYVDGLFIVQKDSKEAADIDFLVDDTQKELERVDIPGFRFNRDKHSIEDIKKKIIEHKK